MKLIIAGGRDFHGFKGMWPAESVDLCISKPDLVTEVVCGLANGGDRCGKIWARKNKKPIKPFPADWEQYGKSAGYRRNAEMAEYADCLLAFWDGESKGTKHMIDLAKKAGLTIKVVNYDGKDITDSI